VIDIKGVIAKAPVRVALLDCGSDIPEFFMNFGTCHILSLAITKYVTVCLWHKEPSYSSEKDEILCDGIENPYIEKAMKNSPLLRWKITTESDITNKGSGLGGSSAFSVALMSAIYPGASKENIWFRASMLEIKEMKSPIGYQDSWSSVYGGLNHFSIDKNMLFNKVNLGDELARKLAENILIFKLAGERTEHSTLTELNLKMHERAPYITEAMGYAQPMQDALLRRAFETVGGYMQDLWALTLKIHGMPEDFAKEYMDAGINAGAYAGKVSGSMSNGAGHLFFLCPPDTQYGIRAKMEEFGLPELYFDAELEGVKVWEID
jgi:D-glycero-alpha-D-manno-heptose-7-phosphate kinase